MVRRTLAVMSSIHARLVAALRAALDDLGATEVDAVVEPSSRADFGDWSTPAALRAARVLRRAPLLIAEELRERLTRDSPAVVRAWSVSPPGYVNARLDEAVWAPEVIGAALALDAATPLAGPGPGHHGKTLVEHTAINTNKAAHLGHLRNASLGDAVARILRRTGERVEVNNYIDDTGAQVADVVVGIRELGLEAREGEPFDQFCSRAYVEVSRRYQEQPQLMESRRTVLQDIEARRNPTAAFVKELAARVVAAHLVTMRRFDIGYDLLTWESDIIELGFWRRAFDQLRERGALVLADSGKNEGCWIMPLDAEADPAEPADADPADGEDIKILVKSDGVATYTAKDIAYQLWKFGLLGLDFHYRSWDASDPDAPATTAVTDGGPAELHGYGHAERVVNVIDTRQAYPQGVVKQALRRLGYREQADNSVHLGYEVVALSPAAAAELGVEMEEGRTRYALSGRRGIEVRADDVLDRTLARVREKAADEQTAQALAAGAVRFYLLKFSLNQPITFDFDDALRTTGETGIYLQYAHARAAGILRKVASLPGELRVPGLLEASERALLHRLDGYALALGEAAAALSPNLLTGYAFALASALSDFYEHTPPVVREQDPALRHFRRQLVAATRATLADVLRTLGMAAPERV
ncbi:MAG: arginine--tRNA ligase [Candidatus Dormibacteria bacterium]